MPNFVLIRHKCRDFTEWKRGYVAHLPKRAAAGLTEKYVLHSDADPNEVILLFEAADLKKAKAFADSAELKEVMKAVGVIDKPDVYFLKG